MWPRCRWCLAGSSLEVVVMVGFGVNGSVEAVVNLSVKVGGC